MNAPAGGWYTGPGGASSARFNYLIGSEPAAATPDDTAATPDDTDSGTGLVYGAALAAGAVLVAAAIAMWVRR